MVGMNYVIANWLQSQGPLRVFGIMGGTHAAVTLLAIPVYIYGKRMRSWTARNSLCRKILQRHN
jgi:hypothetical protein